MKSLIKYIPKATCLLLIFITLFTGCSNKPGSQHEEDKIKSSSISPPQMSPVITPKELPPSRYLSAQSTENLRPENAQRGGNDPNYRLLNPRRIEKIGPNYDESKPGHIEGLRKSIPQDAGFYDPRKEVRVILKPKEGEEISSQVLLDKMLGDIDSPKSQFEAETLKRIYDMREAAIKKNGPGPGVVLIGQGPSGLLALLEAYTAGAASIIAIEQRSQYTRPQILRLTPDTIRRLSFFAGPALWKYFIGFGYISNSPNWSFNKYDFKNPFLYPKLTDIQRKIAKTSDPAEKQTLELEKQSEEKKIFDNFSAEEMAAITKIQKQDLELNRLK